MISLTSLQLHQTLPGIQHISGDMFESVPLGDAIFMKHVLHIWDDEQTA